jgi:hypothetical protein
MASQSIGHDMWMDQRQTQDGDICSSNPARRGIIFLVIIALEYIYSVINGDTISHFPRV